MTPYEKLDIILKELWTPRTYKDLKATISNGKYREISVELLEQGIEKLREDGHAYVIDDKRYVTALEIEDEWYVRKSYKGDMLILNGGYVADHKITENRRVNEIQRNILLIIGTLVAGFGALILVGWDMYKTFHLEHCH